MTRNPFTGVTDPDKKWEIYLKRKTELINQVNVWGWKRKLAILRKQYFESVKQIT